MIKFRNKKPTRTSPKKILKDYKQYREQLSLDFNHRCAYCDDYDNIRNSSFEIDHFIPQKYLKKKKVNIAKSDIKLLRSIIAYTSIE